MLKKFAEGLVFGCGFGISFVVISYVATYVISPMFFASKFEHARDAALVEPGQKPEAVDPHRELTDESSFHDLDIDEQIKRASVIALAKYEPAPDGQMKAVIT